jgi:hypothetical protein
VTLREKRRLRMLDSTVLRKVFRSEVGGGNRRLHVVA